jgi:hypothetical protein
MQHTFLAGRRDHHGDRGERRTHREGGDGDQGKGQVDPGVVREVERHLERCQCDDRCIDQRRGDASWKTFQPGRHGRR